VRLAYKRPRVPSQQKEKGRSKEGEKERRKEGRKERRREGKKEVEKEEREKERRKEREKGRRKVFICICYYISLFLRISRCSSLGTVHWAWHWRSSGCSTPQWQKLRCRTGC
jgi:hypothetical protein